MRMRQKQAHEFLAGWDDATQAEYYYITRTERTQWEKPDPPPKEWEPGARCRCRQSSIVLANVWAPICELPPCVRCAVCCLVRCLWRPMSGLQRRRRRSSVRGLCVPPQYLCVSTCEWAGRVRYLFAVVGELPPAAISTDAWNY